MIFFVAVWEPELPDVEPPHADIAIAEAAARTSTASRNLRIKHVLQSVRAAWTPGASGDGDLSMAPARVNGSNKMRQND
ncbi:hypothetical protein GCM10027613_38550 [Microlunatus endophyticus]